MNPAIETLMPKTTAVGADWDLQRAASARDAQPARGRKQRVLVAEDEERIVRFLALKLKASGFDVLVARDGLEAMEHVRSTAPPDLMVLDLSMPRKDGFETLAELRSFSRLPVIIVSGLETDELALLRQGADDFLPKPFNPRDLMDRIQALLQ